ncbi:MAG: hypothetical protein P4M11_10950 [Candidatus Pacebacteria bacterium]|nr:hypothetical protein [Candidatus Paceibacterota bacterium]
MLLRSKNAASVSDKVKEMKRYEQEIFARFGARPPTNPDRGFGYVSGMGTRNPLVLYTRRVPKPILTAAETASISHFASHQALTARSCIANETVCSQKSIIHSPRFMRAIPRLKDSNMTKSSLLSMMHGQSAKLPASCGTLKNSASNSSSTEPITHSPKGKLYLNHRFGRALGPKRRFLPITRSAEVSREAVVTEFVGETMAQKLLALDAGSEEK